MATITDNGQTYLEKEAIAARKDMLQNNKYSKENEYDKDGKNAAKGTGDLGGHGFTVPDMTKPKTELNYQFNTSDGGDSCDKQARKVMTARSLYSAEHPYNYNNINTSANVADGQYDGNNPTITWTCPVL